MIWKNNKNPHLTKGGKGQNGRKLNPKNIYASEEPEDQNLFGPAKKGNKGEQKNDMDSNKTGIVSDSKDVVVKEPAPDTAQEGSNSSVGTLATNKEDLKNADQMRNAKVPVYSGNI